MSDKSIRRVVGGASVLALSAGFAATVGAGVAGAAPASVTWDDGSERITRTISDVNPAEGDIITSTTQFDRTGGVVEYIYEVKDVHPTCLTYVDGSAKVDGSPRGLDSQGADFAKVKGSSIEWPLYPHISPNLRTFEFSYKVGANCDRNVPLMTTVHYGGSLGSGTYQNKGPAVSVKINTSTTALTAPADVQVGQSVPLKATVTGGAEGNPVEFFDGGAKLGEAPLNGAGEATFNWTPTTRGAHGLSAKFLATPRAEGSQSSVQTVQVAQADAVSSTVLAPISGAEVGRSTVLRATVSPAGAGGTVAFKDGAATLADVPVDANGVAIYTWVPSTAGSHSIAATFSGRSGVTGSTANATVTVAAAPAGNTNSTTVLTLGGAPKVGAAQTISAQVTPGDAGGTVTFKDGDIVIGTAQVNAGGQASLSWTPANEGQRVITAEYSGAGTVNASADQESVVVTGTGGGTPGGAGSLGSIFGS
ncbi:Ig-like domain-containing protein [Rhodococcus sp. UNC363MFTsu5.1]|uniref:Ig-like domain-containing protein n=1 Tax=Rhodococcus sp. UNC363MFTsu5.1 TaxID=1449069 RepID=UPI000484790D|nr:Ig-like domain-containing protein [Rhodococcus sp. UNC363MFTsu5.1]